MDFALLPPEVNSARMYSGAGSGPILAAAASWDALAVELQTVGLAYDSVIDDLGSGWTGPSAATMAAAAAPYAQWMHTTSAQAEHTAIQAKAAAAAYEAAFAMTVPPPTITANRSQLMTLLATNSLGQNTVAIAAAEAHYAEMWAQDAAAMYSYAGSAAAASTLTPFTEPPQTTNPAGSAAQVGAVGQTTATSAANQTNTVTSAITQALQGLASPAAAAPPLDASPLVSALTPAAAADPLTLAYLALASSLFGTFIIDSAGTFGVDVAGTFGIDLIGVGEIGAELLPIAELTSSVTPVAASLGEAASISGLSVPQAWTVAAPSVIQQVSTALPAAGAAATPAVAASETTIPFAQMAGAGLAGRATAGIGRGQRGGAGTTTRQRPVPPPQPAQQPEPPKQPEQPQRPVNGPITRISGELRELADLHNAGILTDEEFTEQKQRLLGR